MPSFHIYPHIHHQQNQSSFIPGRLIWDNVVIGFEYMNWIRNKRKNKTRYAALKLDMSKAYDIVEFSSSFNAQMGFAERCVNLIMSRVTSLRYLFRLNQPFFGEIVPQLLYLNLHWDIKSTLSVEVVKCNFPIFGLVTKRNVIFLSEGVHLK